MNQPRKDTFICTLWVPIYLSINWTVSRGHPSLVSTPYSPPPPLPISQGGDSGDPSVVDPPYAHWASSTGSVIEQKAWMRKGYTLYRVPEFLCCRSSIPFPVRNGSPCLCLSTPCMYSSAYTRLRGKGAGGPKSNDSTESLVLKRRGMNRTDAKIWELLG
jgi:hypothetical protein